VFLFIDEFGPGELVSKTDERIEYLVIERPTGRKVLRVGCAITPNSSPTVFHRFLEVGSLFWEQK